MKNNKIIYLILFCVIIIYYSFAVNNQPGLAGDDSGYIIWAKSILNGGGLDYTNEPTPRPSGFKLYALPLILTPILKFTDNLILIKFVPLIFSAAAILLFLYYLNYFFYKRELIIFAGLILIYNGLFFDYSNQVMAENIFIFFTLITIIAAEKYKCSVNTFNLNFIILVLSAIAAYYTRSAGIALIISIIVYFIICGCWRKFILILIIFCLFFTVIFYPSKKNSSGTAETYFSIIRMKSQYTPEAGGRTITDIIKDSTRKIAVYSIRLMPDAFFYPLFKGIKPAAHKYIFSLQAILGLFITSVIIVGFICKNSIKKNNRLKFKFVLNKIKMLDVYVIITILMLLVWQIYSSRYLLPILPFLIIYFVIGLNKLFASKPRIFKYIAALIIFIGFCGQMHITYINQNHKLPQEWQDYYATLDYIMTAEKNNPENINVVCRKPLSYHLKSGYKIKTIGYPMTMDINSIHKFMLENKIDYIVRDNFSISGPHTAEIYLDPYIKKYSEYLEPKYFSDDRQVVLYRFKKT